MFWKSFKTLTTFKFIDLCQTILQKIYLTDEWIASLAIEIVFVLLVFKFWVLISKKWKSLKLQTKL